jgi:hypothetical protein
MRVAAGVNSLTRIYVSVADVAPAACGAWLTARDRDIDLSLCQERRVGGMQHARAYVSVESAC